MLIFPFFRLGFDVLLLPSIDALGSEVGITAGNNRHRLHL